MVTIVTGNYEMPLISQNIHLVKSWLPRLDKILNEFAACAHKDYRVFMSAEPADKPESHILPQVGIQSGVG